MSIWQSFKKWALKPTPLHTELAEMPCEDMPYWKRDPEIGEPVRAMLIALEKCPSRFKFKAEYLVRMNTLQWRGTVTDSITGEKFNYSGNTRAISTFPAANSDWKPMATAHWEWLALNSRRHLTYSDISVNVEWMTEREKSFVRGFIVDILQERIKRTSNWRTERQKAEWAKREAMQVAIAEKANKMERDRLIEIYKGEWHG